MTTMTEVHEPQIGEQIPPETDISKSPPLPLLQPLLRECEMKKEHTYRVTAWWTAGQSGLTKSESAPNAVHFTAPPQFGGMAGRWTPEDLLLSAVASCFTTTFHAV